LSIFLKTKKFVLDTLFPISCINCNKDGFWLCDDCLHDIELLSIQVCPKCEDTITDSGLTCRNCKPSNLDGLLVASGYKENNIRKFVHLYKYRFVEDLHIPLGKLLTKTILQSNLPIPDLILPVPLHSRRLRWRGFNQSQLLAEYVSQNLTPNLEIPVDKNLLTRQKYTPPQMKIKKYQERLTNLQNAFAINSVTNRLPFFTWTPSVQVTQAILAGKTILLIDDIATTGATLFECAKILKQNGAKKVFGAVIARQEMK
jgi:ComF family protein